jgi:two-component system alkaline phosphatase synthesis response regulator PhoP
MIKNPKILSIDDDSQFQEILTSALAVRGLKIEVAHGSEEGVERAKKLIPDIILMDVEMPHKDGIATATEILTLPRMENLKILFLTNLGDPSPMISQLNHRFAKQVGAAGYIKKGGDLNKLAEEIRRLCN